MQLRVLGPMLVLAGVVALLVVATTAALLRARRARPRPGRGASRRGAAARRAGADRADAGPVAAARAPGRRARGHARHARQPARRPAPQPGRHRRHARRRRRAERRRPAPGRPDARRRRLQRHASSSSTPHRAAARRPPYQTGPISAIVLAGVQSRRHAPRERGMGRRGGFVDLFDGRTRRHIARLDPGDPLWGAVATRELLAGLAGARGAGRQRIPARRNRLLRWDARTGRRLGEVRCDPGPVAEPARVHWRRAARDLEPEATARRSSATPRRCGPCASSLSPARSPR